VFTLGSIVSKVVGLFMLPILTRSLTPASFGSMDVLQSLGTALTMPLLLGLDVATLRLFFDQPDAWARRGLGGTSYSIVIGVTSVAALLVAINSSAISTALFGDSSLQAGVLAVAISVVAGGANAIGLTLLRARRRAGWFAALTAGGSVLYAVLAVALLRWWQADANAVLVGYTAALAVSAASGAVLVRRDAFGKPALAAGRRLLRLGLPLTPAVVAGYLADFLNKLILLGAAGAGGVAYFTIAQRFQSVAGIVVVGFHLAWLPRAYAEGTSLPARVRLAEDARWIVAIVCAVVIVVAVVSPEVLVLVAGERYLPALPALGFCLVAVLFGALYLPASLPSAVAKATQDLALAAVSLALVALVSNFFLAPLWHGTGTAAAYAMGQIAETVVVGRLGRRWEPLPVNWVRLGGLATVIGLVVVAILVSNASLVWRLSIGALALVLIGMSVPLRQALVAARTRFMR
jgi:O-antigen/teichoic acid export membrane protein